MRMGNLIDIIIPTLNRQNQIQDCLDSIISQTVIPDNIIIVDASDDQTFEKIIEDKYSGFKVQYIHSKEKGLTDQRNVGIEQSKSDFIVFLDDDIVLLPDFIEKSLEAIKKKPAFSVVTGKIINHHRKEKVNPVLILFQRFFYLQESKDGLFKKSGDYNVKHPSLEGMIEVDVAIGGLTMYRKEIFQDYCFDANFQYLEGYASLEDEDFSLQIKSKYRILYCTDARAYHYHNTAPMTRLSTYRQARLRSFNYRYFYRKHRDAYGFKSYPHCMSCIGMIIEAFINRRSWTMARGLLSGFILFHKKKGEIEKR